MPNETNPSSNEYVISDEDFIALEKVRSMCHGGGAAVALALNGDGRLNLENVLEMLRTGNKTMADFLEKCGGYRRVMALREQGKNV